MSIHTQIASVLRKHKINSETKLEDPVMTKKMIALRHDSTFDDLHPMLKSFFKYSPSILQDRALIGTMLDEFIPNHIHALSVEELQEFAQHAPYDEESFNYLRSINESSIVYIKTKSGYCTLRIQDVSDVDLNWAIVEINSITEKIHTLTH